MNYMKCPYCGSELEFVDYYEGESFYKCPNNSCKYPVNIIQKGIWQDLIASKKAQGELERTRKALEIAIDMLTRITVSPETMTEPEKVVPYLADLALKQITALEQKD